MTDKVVVNAEQMRQIEGQIFDAGMPVAALMEKVVGLIANRVMELYPLSDLSRVGVLVGPGHNGGDALGVARELHLRGYQVFLYRPLSRLKELTTSHANYAASLGIPSSEQIQALYTCNLIIDGLFGFGLTRPISGKLAEDINQLNFWNRLVVSIDLPSGMDTDTGQILGAAVRATHTLCLGLWKRAFYQDQALDYIGKAELISFGIPKKNVWSVLGKPPTIQLAVASNMAQYLPLPRSKITHKYKQGHLLLICGSRRYSGGAILTALGSRASGVGMLSIAVPESLKPLLVSHVPEALVIGCPETESGAIANLPSEIADLSQFNLIACGPGLTKDAISIVQGVLKVKIPLVLDADALNIVAELGTLEVLKSRKYPTILTPHLGEFKRLFPNLANPNQDRIRAVQEATKQSKTVILLKGAKTVIAHPGGKVWLVPESTPALARGGSGDVLTGLLGGLLGQKTNYDDFLEATVATAAWWHAQAGIIAVRERSELGVDAHTLCQYLWKVPKKITDYL